MGGVGVDGNPTRRGPLARQQPHQLFPMRAADRKLGTVGEDHALVAVAERAQFAHAPDVHQGGAVDADEPVRIELLRPVPAGSNAR